MTVSPTDNTQPLWYYQIYASGELIRKWFRVGLAFWGTFTYLLIVTSVRTGNPGLAFLGELTSTLPVDMGGWLWEDKCHWKVDRQTQLQRRFSPKTQSWAFLCDFVGLAPMLLFAALVAPLMNFPLYDGPTWLVWSWIVIPVLPALAISWLFRKGEGDVADPLSYVSFTKLLHNGVAFTVLCSVMIYVIPLLVWGTVWGFVWGIFYQLHFVAVWSSLGLLGLGIWAAAAFLDGKRANYPDGHPYALRMYNLHRPTGRWGMLLPEDQRREIERLRETNKLPTWDEFVKRNPDQMVLWTSIFHTRKLEPMLLQLMQEIPKWLQRIWVRPEPEETTQTQQTGYEGPPSAPGVTGEPPERPG